jgi:hypothetical protein
MDVRAYALARLGREAEARTILDLLAAKLKEGKPAEFSIAVVHMGLREYDLALDALERLNATEGLDLEILVDPIVREMREMPRFQALIEKAGLKGELKDRKAAQACIQIHLAKLIILIG